MSTLNDILPKSARPKPTSELGQVVATQRGWEVTHDRNGYCELLTEYPGLLGLLTDNGFNQYGVPVGGDSGEGGTETEAPEMSRDSLMKMDFSKLKALALENEVTEKSREKIVNELCSLFGLE